VHEVGAFSARIVQTFGAKRARFVRDSFSFRARIWQESLHDGGTNAR
jgi:hypothetical protein